MIETFGLGCEIHGRSLLKDISLCLVPGGMTVVLGENGAGKTSLLRCLAGGIKPSCGRVLFHGRDLSSWRADELAKQRAVLLQDGMIHFPFTALEIVQMGRHPYPSRNGSAAERELCEQALMLLDVHHLRRCIFSSLSGGERQRVQLARALVQVWQVENACLLLDEPTSALDLKHQRQVLSLIARLSKQYRMTVVCVMHDLHLANRFFDQAILLRQGRVLAVGDVGSVLNVGNLEKTYDVRIERIRDERGGSYFVNV